MNTHSSTRPLSIPFPTLQIFSMMVLCFLAFSGAPALAEGMATESPRWWRGNLHTHTFWSDGDDFPESVAKWYKDHGYDFLAHTDHNVLLEGERWKSFPEEHRALARYRELFGNEWVRTRPDEKEGHVQVQLRPLSEFRGLFEEPGRFLLIMGDEITNAHGVHLVALHQERHLGTAGGNVGERARMVGEVVHRVDAYRKESGRNTHAILAHPNFVWALTAEKMIAVEILRFFEVYNAHPLVQNEGDAFRAGTDRLWDIVLAFRLSGGGLPLLGVATDDAHNYFGGGAGPGRGWVMVRSARLTPESLLDALDQGDFYASTGVTLREIKRTENGIRVEIEPEDGVEYVTEYVGTRVGFDPESTPALDQEGKEIPNTTRKYSPSIGEVLYRTTDLNSDYHFTGDELYVRVRIESTADQLDSITGNPIGTRQRAWGQPMRPTFRPAAP